MSGIKIPRLKITLDDNAYKSIENRYIYYEITWKNASLYKKDEVPNWMVEDPSFPYCKEFKDNSSYFMVSKKTSTSLERLLKGILDIGNNQYRNKDEKQRSNEKALSFIREYSFIVRDELMDTQINDFLKTYSNACLKNFFPPIINIENHVRSVFWPFCSFNEDEKDSGDILETLWCRKLSIGITGEDNLIGDREDDVKNIFNHNNPKVAVITRMVKDIQDIKTTDEIVFDIYKIIEGINIWDSSSNMFNKAINKPFGKVLDIQNAFGNRIQEMRRALDDKTKFPLYIYHGHSENDITMKSGRTDQFIAHMSQNQRPTNIPFQLQKLGEAGKTLIVSSCKSSEIGTIEYFNDVVASNPDILPGFASLDSAKYGVNWVASPLKLDCEDGLLFTRSFVHKTCISSMPVAELLRQTIDEIASAPNPPFSSFSFVLHGEATKKLPFITDNIVNFHYSEDCPSTIDEFVKRIRHSPAIPIIPNVVKNINLKDHDLFKMLGLYDDVIPTFNDDLNIYIASAAAIGQAICHPKYGKFEEQPRLYILGVAFTSSGGNRLCLPNKDEEDIMAYINGNNKLLFNEDQYFSGFWDKSFTTTLLRICLHEIGVDKTISKDDSAYEEVLFKNKLKDLKNKNNPCLFYGYEFTNEFLKNTKKELVDELKVVIINKKYLDLDLLFSRAYRHDQNINVSEKLPMLLFIALKKPNKNNINGGELHSLREFLYHYRKIKDRLEYDDWTKGGSDCIFQKSDPSYLTSLSNEEIQILSEFMLRAINYEIWSDIDESIKIHLNKASLKTILLYLINNSLFIDSNSVDAGCKKISYACECKNTLESIDNLLWGNKIAADLHERFPLFSKHSFESLLYEELFLAIDDLCNYGEGELPSISGHDRDDIRIALVSILKTIKNSHKDTVILDYGCGKGPMVRALSEIKRKMEDNFFKNTTYIGVNYETTFDIIETVNATKIRDIFKNVIIKTDKEYKSGEYDVDIAYLIDTIHRIKIYDLPIILNEIFKDIKINGSLEIIQSQKMAESKFPWTADDFRFLFKDIPGIEVEAKDNLLKAYGNDFTINYSFCTIIKKRSQETIIEYIREEKIKNLIQSKIDILQEEHDNSKEEANTIEDITRYANLKVLIPYLTKLLKEKDKVANTDC